MLTREEAIDFTTAEGARIRARLEARLGALRLQNDALELDAESTAAIRGRIAEIKTMLTGAPPAVTSTHYSPRRART